ncbi:hypothetical protein PZE06_12450 [Robertmurraya sp. DFI.2.37]|uniref:hypothetical protein n=1 Tax=Robertmurraya sp. DFI.2.37 TaxID=3031819 RepID=UPI001244AD2A|nr:hypothetical protein [Robertmurraya sp. DFI.2.37]MDF1508981.1 hypothetical protein [Robertmurraya sp. DFI.2.37]
MVEEGQLSDNQNELEILSSGGTHYDNVTDPTYSARGYITFYYTNVNGSGGTYVRWDSVSGGWQALTSGISFTDRSVYLTQQGGALGGGTGNRENTINVNTTYSIRLGS